jgi:pimeloyl-ACP methyl ester esterase
MKLSVPIVLLHGWGCDSHIWEPLISQCEDGAIFKTIDLDYSKPTLAVLCDWLADQLPNPCVLCGWSLGGMLAVRLAALYPEKIIGLITLASNVTFVEKKNWPHAMPQQTFDEFYQLVEKDSGRGLKRFLVLETLGDEYAKQQKQWLNTLAEPDLFHKYSLHALQLLAEINNADVIAKVTCPAIYVFGENDTLVPIGVAQNLQRKININQTIKIFKNRGHLLHYPFQPLVDDFEVFKQKVVECHG